MYPLTGDRCCWCYCYWCGCSCCCYCYRHRQPWRRSAYFSKVCHGLTEPILLIRVILTWRHCTINGNRSQRFVVGRSLADDVDRSVPSKHSSVICYEKMITDLRVCPQLQRGVKLRFKVYSWWYKTLFHFARSFSYYAYSSADLHAFGMDATVMDHMRFACQTILIGRNRIDSS